MGRRRAIIIGGGIAGMCAASALSGKYDDIVVLERDTYPDSISPRRGVPQSRMFHTLIERGRRDMEALYPGFHKLLAQHKVPRTAFGFNVALMTPRGWTRSAPAPVMRTVICSRWLLECTLHELFQQLPGVTVMEAATVSGLLADKTDGHMVCTGVRVRRKGTGGTEEMTGDLVVDAAGAASRASRWLTELGLALPEEETLDPLLTYGGQLYRLREGVRWPAKWWWTHGAFIQRMPPDDRFAGHFVRQEEDLWLLTLVAGAGEEIPRNPQGIEHFAGQMRSPLVRDMLPLFEPVSEMQSYRLPSNSRKHYETWGERLDGFIAMGAATCVFNPNQGQGMSAAAASAAILKDCASRTTDPARLPGLYFKEQARFQNSPWRIAICNDLKFDAVQGARPLSVRLYNWYRDALARAPDSYVLRVTGEADMLLRPWTDVLSAAVAVRAAFANLFLWWRRNPSRAERDAPYPPPAAEMPRRLKSRVRDAVMTGVRAVTYRLGLAR